MAIYVPALIHSAANSRNGMYPSAYLHTQLAEAHRHIGQYRHRCVYSRGFELGVDNSASGTRTVARWRFRTGYHVSQVAALVISLPTTDRGGWSGNGPYAEIDLTISGGATTTLGPYSTGIEVGTPNDAPDGMNTLMLTASVSANTVYECALRLIDYSRVAAVMLFELGPSDPDDVNPHRFAAGRPIYDVQRQDLFVGLSNIHTRGGGICEHWSLLDGTARTRTSATPINLVDGTSTGTPTAGAHPGVYIDASYHNRRRSTTVAFEFACYASQSSGTGVVRLIDTSGNVYGSCSVTSATPGWVVATANLPASETFLAPQFYSDGVGTLSCYATSLVETG